MSLVCNACEDTGHDVDGSRCGLCHGTRIVRCDVCGVQDAIGFDPGGTPECEACRLAVVIAEAAPRWASVIGFAATLFWAARARAKIFEPRLVECTMGAQGEPCTADDGRPCALCVEGREPSIKSASLVDATVSP